MIELTGYRDKHEYVNKHGVKSVVYLMDCMDAMAQMGENEFGLACCDVPYGIGEDGGSNHTRSKIAKAKTFEAKGWDKSAPECAYFDKLKTISSNQIIWGANHFLDNVPFNISSPCWIVWDKENGASDFADAELAWTSFRTAVRVFRFKWAGMLQGDMKNKEERIHPTQKPVALYDWIFHNYAKPNDTIFDSHLGSGSSRIAADKHNLPFFGVEKDSDYFRDHVKRFNRYTSQLTLF
jgi:site-specific DNA-methyltransferase (adenine-specific)